MQTSQIVLYKYYLIALKSLELRIKNAQGTAKKAAPVDNAKKELDYRFSKTKEKQERHFGQFRK